MKALKRARQRQIDNKEKMKEPIILVIAIRVKEAVNVSTIFSISVTVALPDGSTDSIHHFYNDPSSPMERFFSLCIPDQLDAFSEKYGVKTLYTNDGDCLRLIDFGFPEADGSNNRRIEVSQEQAVDKDLILEKHMKRIGELAYKFSK